jgi:glycosyltransferase involved in cell wall biosynthesis
MFTPLREWGKYSMLIQAQENKKRLLFIIDSLGVGGAERQTIDLLNKLSIDKFEIGLVYLYPQEDLLPRLNVSRLKVVKYLHRKGKFDPGLLKRLTHIIQTGQFEIVVCINEYPLLNAYLAKIFYHLDFLLVTVLHHTTLRPGFWEWLKNKLYIRILNKCDNVVFVSKNQKKYWSEKYNINKPLLTYIHNGIDETSYVDTFTIEQKTAIRKQLGFHSQDIIYGICARLDSHKNHEDFIAAIHIASKTLPQIKALIIGDGPQKAILKKIIRNNSLEHVVKFAGYQADVRPYLAICDSMVISSRHNETFSIAALESMAMKKPMIMTNIGGASEQIMEGVTGFLYELGNIRKLSELMITMSDHSRSQKMGEKAADQVKTNFSLDQMVTNYERFFLGIEPRQNNDKSLT